MLSNKRIQDLGVGIILAPGLESLVESLSSFIDVIEIEPQTMWYKHSLESDSFSLDENALSFINSLPQPKIFHGVGFPVGGTVVPSENHFSTFNQHAEIIKPVYTSEHLSFNRYRDNKGIVHQTNFLLPPIQNNEGISVAVNSINYYKSKIQLPFAFETGTNYLRKLPNEIQDSKFITEIVEQSDSLILLDLHNILCNALNGRQKVMDFLNQIPCERVIEIHIAGGGFYKNYYLDAHSAVSSSELLSITKKAIGIFPNVKSLIFELMPEYYTFDRISKKDIENQLVAMHRLWDIKGKNIKKDPSQNKKSIDRMTLNTVKVSDWEFILGSIVNSCNGEEDELSLLLKKDSGIEVIKDLIFEFRASAVVSALKMTCRFIKMNIGTERFNRFLRDFCSVNESEIFIYSNAERFSLYLKSINLTIPNWKDILEFEIALINTKVDGIKRFVDFNYDPFPVFESLADYKRPNISEQSNSIYRIEITPDLSFDKENSDLLKIHSVFHN